MSIEARVEKLEEGLARAERRVQHTQKRMQSFGDAAGSVASRGLRAMAAGMGAATAAAAAQDKQWVALSATILASFAAGGPWAGAIALIGAGVGVMIARSSEGARKWEENMKRISAATAKAAADVRSAQESMFVKAGGTSGLFRLDEADRRIKELGDRIDSSTYSESSAAESGARVRAYFDEREHRAKLVELVRLEAQQMGDQIVIETRLLGIADERLRKEEEIRAERDRLIATFERMQESGVPTPEGFASWDTIKGFVNERAQRSIDQLPRKMQEVSEAAKVAARSVSDLLSSIVVDGASAENALRSLARSFLSMGIQKGVGAVFGLERP